VTRGLAPADELSTSGAFVPIRAVRPAIVSGVEPVRRFPRGTLPLCVLALALATLSLLIGDSIRCDPLGWLRWGRQIALGDGSFSTVDYPSWKPLPVAFTVPLAATGDAAQSLWLVLARAAGFMAIALTFRLGRTAGGWLAGAVAVVALAFLPDWWPTLEGGGIEPMLLALTLFAVECHLAGRRLVVLGLGALVALGREEAFVLLAIYGLVLARRQPRHAALVALVLAAVPAAWLGGDWLGSGDPLHGGALAQQAPVAFAQQPERALSVTGELFFAPLWCAIALGLLVAWRRRRPLIGALGAAAALWVAIDLAIAARGYPAEARFMLPAAGLLSVVAGTGVSTAAAWLRAAPWAGPGGRHGRRAHRPSQLAPPIQTPPHTLPFPGAMAGRSASSESTI
jgi:hypothetical protein